MLMAICTMVSMVCIGFGAQTVSAAVDTSAMPQLQLDVRQSVTVNDAAPEAYCAFTPAKDGYYFFKSISANGVNGNLYDQNMNLLNGHGTSYGDFRFGGDLTGGTTYVLGVRSWSGEADTFHVMVEESPVVALTVQPLSVYEGTTGYTTSYWDSTLQQYVDYYRYNWQYYTDFTVRMKDGSTVESHGTGFSYGDEWYSTSASDNQGQGEQWLAGNTYTGTVSVMGVTAPVQITIEESPVVAIELNPILLPENENGYQTTGYDQESGSYKEYFHYWWNNQISGTVVFKDGQRVTLDGNGIYYNNEWYSLSYEDDQDYTNRMLPGNTYAKTIKVMGKQAQVQISVVSPVSTEDYKYVVQDGMAVIMDCYLSEERLQIPETLGGYPVVGINSLGNAMKTVKELVIPDSVTMLSGRTFYIEDYYDPAGLPLEKLHLGSGVSNINISMLENAKKLESITVSGDNANYCSIDGVVYDKACTRMVAFPPAKQELHIVPDTVEDVSIIFEYSYLYTNANVQLGSGVEDYVSEGGVIYNKDKTVIYKANANMTGHYVMPDTVKEIQSHAFSGSSLTEVTLSKAVTEIVYGAFAHSKKLEKVNMPEGLKTIGFQAFYDCTALKTVELPSSVRVIDYSAFYNCTALKSVYITDLVAWSTTEFYGNTSNPLYYAGDLYLNGQKVTKLELPETVGEKVYSYAFCNGSFTEVVLPKTIKAIGEDAFSNSSVQKINLPEGLERIGYSAFEGSDLQSVKLPDSLTELDSYAFENCTSLKEVTIGKGLTSINSNTFANTGLKKLVLPANITWVGWEAFSGSELTEVVFENDAIQIEGRAFYECPLQAIELGDQVEYIGERAFQGSHAYTVEIPEAVTEISYRCFAFNYNLVSVTISENVNYIDPCAFEDDSNLTHVLYKGDQDQWQDLVGLGEEFPDTTVHFNAKGDELTFNNTCTHIKYFCKVCNQHFAAKKVRSTHVFEDGVCTVCGHGGLWDYETNADGKSVTVTGYLGEEKEITIPATLGGLPVTAIGDGAFTGSKLTGVTVPESVTVIGSRAFDSCQWLRTLNLPEKLTSVGSYAFRSTGLHSVTLPEGITELPEGTFMKSRINEITLPQSLKTIGNKAFANCGSLETVNMPQKLEGIGEEAFLECNRLKEIVIPEGVTQIPKKSFMYCYNLSAVELPDTVTEISYFSFYYCDALQQLSIPASVQKIKNNAASECYNLDTIVFEGDAPEIQQWAFEYVNATAVYRAGNKTWTEDKMQNYGGELTWRACDTPVITCQPFDVREDEGVKAVAVVMYTGDFVTAQWYKAAPGSDQFEPTGVYGNSFELTMEDATNGTRVYCVLTNALGDTVTSNTVTLRMNPKLTGIRISQLPYTVEYSLRQQLRTRGLIVVATYSDGSEKVITDYAARGFDPMVAGKQAVTVAYKDFTAKFEVTVDQGKTNFTDPDQQVEINAPAGALNSNTQLHAEKLMLEDTPAILDGHECVAFELTLEQDGQEVQPAAPVEVWLPLPVEIQAKSCKVYYLPGDGTAVDMQAKYKDGGMLFLAEHFSCYVLAEQTGVQVSGKITGAAGGQPVVVSLLSGGEVLESKEVTDSYLFENLVPGTYAIEAGGRVYALQVADKDLTQDIALLTPGDMDGNDAVNVDDAIYLLQHVLMPNVFQIAQPADYDGSGAVDVDDAIYLLQHVLMPNVFPLK
jgi:hypothetical protein